ncbi:hypothetical protein Bca52824_018708 [Brassica carinata]|uniref:Uncharacterized protein n=1 Tax=Brassica carinata TaxID=52824 RepID=A0A8X7VQ80_BRACI|nr:hypothetical protein Bca52824_018708 [Brassica carinata]
MLKGEQSKRRDVNGRCDGLLWYKDSGNHVAGDFSMSVIQANNLLEDHIKLESGPVSLFDSCPQATFVWCIYMMVMEVQKLHVLTRETLGKRMSAGNCEEAHKKSSKRGSKEERDEIF